MFGRCSSHSESGDKNILLEANQMICSHTPLKKMVPAFGDKFILVTGNGNVLDVCKHYGFQKPIHVEELYSLMPDIAPFIYKEYP